MRWIIETCLCRFFSLLVQRAAKMHRRNGGGSMTILLVLAGRPATGILKKAPDVSKYKHLSPELRAKLEAKLAADAKSQALTKEEIEERAQTELVEEFMSMSDGQTVLRLCQSQENLPGQVSKLLCDYRAFLLNSCQGMRLSKSL